MTGVVTKPKCYMPTSCMSPLLLAVIFSTLKLQQTCLCNLIFDMCSLTSSAFSLCFSPHRTQYGTICHWTSVFSKCLAPKMTQERWAFQTLILLQTEANACNYETNTNRRVCLVSQLAAFTVRTFFLYFAVYQAISGRKMLPLNGCQDSDSLEMHGMLVIYYEPPTPTELHFKCKERLVCWTGTDGRCGWGKKKSKTCRDGAITRLKSGHFQNLASLKYLLKVLNLLKKTDLICSLLSSLSSIFLLC